MVSTGSIIQGRWIGPAEMEFIRGLLAENPGWNRTRLSRELCVSWGWRNERGQVKDMAARTMLLYFVKRFSPKKSYKNTHQAVGTFTWPLCFMSAFFIL